LGCGEHFDHRTPPQRPARAKKATPSLIKDIPNA
jgi:hypothetical protein